jgi:hypothetical protein
LYGNMVRLVMSSFSLAVRDPEAYRYATYDIRITSDQLFLLASWHVGFIHFYGLSWVEVFE